MRNFVIAIVALGLWLLYQVSQQVPTADRIAKDKFIQELEKIQEGL